VWLPAAPRQGSACALVNVGVEDAAPVGNAYAEEVFFIRRQTIYSVFFSMPTATRRCHAADAVRHVCRVRRYAPFPAFSSFYRMCVVCGGCVR